MAGTIASIIKPLIPRSLRHEIRIMPRKAMNVGLRFHCPICRWSYRNFTPRGDTINREVFERFGMVGGGYRPHAVCPGCGSHDRERLLYLFLKQHTDLFAGTRRLSVMHSAPERNLRRLIRSQPHIEYLDVDLDPDRASMVVNLVNIPLEDNRFDVVLCNHVLQEILDDRKAMSEIHRVLKPGGWAILQVPIAGKLKVTLEDPSLTTDEQQWAAFGDIRFRRVYGADYADRIAGAGFKVEVHPFATELGAAACRRMGLIADEQVFVCRKV